MESNPINKIKVRWNKYYFTIDKTASLKTISDLKYEIQNIPKFIQMSNY